MYSRLHNEKIYNLGDFKLVHSCDALLRFVLPATVNKVAEEWDLLRIGNVLIQYTSITQSCNRTYCLHIRRVCACNHNRSGTYNRTHLLGDDIVKYT